MGTAVRDAATVILVRDGDRRTDGLLEVFLQRRTKSMAFAAGMTVFPGGSVEESDFDTSVPWFGGDTGSWRPDDFARCLDVPVPTAKALVCAAVRETFEECGALLACRSDGTELSASEVADGAAQHRGELVAGTMSIAEILRKYGLALRADLLLPVDNWITPEPSPRRYDTRFFLAVLPEGQDADGETSEADECTWMAPSAAIAEWRLGNSVLMPPTWCQLTRLLDIQSTQEVSALRDDARAGEPLPAIQPIMERHDGQLRTIFPNCEAYYLQQADRPNATT
ncbi:NUDIX hydrolase [Hoyosella subflava]|uniref:Nudix hydrolase domain-containing protein n=1 Tax=Hoyosella subflava (strain DSM 45089 / JCM 17490 / NBRC 109087 / DQS3-9A1) TaxID=443218 RepID=F6EGI2_HOYSD|nr:hypothetical protein [Hoyosella subflava]AEF41035.1 hypothetical protein AS9A_2588 [Hoyosella subflava DQS3-9A1]